MKGAVDLLDGGIERGILRLELVCIEEVVVDRPQMPDEMGAPGKLEVVATDNEGKNFTQSLEVHS